MSDRIPKTPEEWRTHDDAYALMKAAEVRQDENRLKKALKWIDSFEKDEVQSKSKAVNSLLKENKKLNGGV
jgi:hypothetical protein